MSYYNDVFMLNCSMFLEIEYYVMYFECEIVLNWKYMYLILVEKIMNTGVYNDLKNVIKVKVIWVIYILFSCS